MKNFFAILLFFLLFSSCLRQPECIDAYPIIISNKDEYNQFDNIIFKAVYSERASYRWFINGNEMPGTSSEFIAPKIIYYQTYNNIRCEATIGKCVKEATGSFSIRYVNVPSCNIPINTITIDNKQFQISNTTFDAKSLTFKGKIIGQGASINDNITIQLSSEIDIYADQGIMQMVQSSFWSNRNDQILVTIIYGNLTFSGYSPQFLSYYHAPAAEIITCCSATMSSSQNGVTFPFNFSFFTNL